MNARTWERVLIASCLCGGCGRQLLRGDPVLVITFVYGAGRGKPTRRVRGECCSGAAPPDLPAIVERTREFSSPPRQPLADQLDWFHPHRRKRAPLPATPVVTVPTPPRDIPPVNVVDGKMRAAEREPGEEG